jgi:hypothetical protein
MAIVAYKFKNQSNKKITQALISGFIAQFKGGWDHYLTKKVT